MTVSRSGVQYIDSHTEGEPTRVVTDGGPDFGTLPMDQLVDRLRDAADSFRCQLIDEPRGYDAIVGALLCRPADPSCVAGVVFFNHRNYLGMCGHGAIGVAVTLAYMNRITPGEHRLETPVGSVGFRLVDANTVQVRNVPSYRLRSGVRLRVDGVGTVTGDVAWGGNWFFLADASPHPLCAENIPQLTEAAWRVRKELGRQNITGTGGAEIDHIEFFGPARSTDADSRNFVLCPGGAYDRSPCGTGTSAKLACLAADGRLAPGQRWIQESIIGTRYDASFEPSSGGSIVPTIQGRAYVCGEGRVIVQPGDPFAWGRPRDSASATENT